MNPEKLEQALNYVRDIYIEEAAAPKRRSPIKWMGTLAAMLALVLLVHTISPIGLKNATGKPESSKADASFLDQASEEKAEAPNESVLVNYGTSSIGKYAVALASTPRVTEYPHWENYSNEADYQQDQNSWRDARSVRTAQLSGALANLSGFFADSSEIFLRSEDGENRIWSPVNGYIALAMLAETTGGTTRQQLLDALNTPDLNTLRAQVSAVWESVYAKDETGVSTLSNSLWLDKELTYHQQPFDALAYHHYASSYIGDLGSEEMNEALHTWLNEQTGGFLEDAINALALDSDSVLALASTAYLCAYWADEFDAEHSTEDVFHAPKGDTTTIFMHKTGTDSTYYRGENFGAVYLELASVGGMWLFLPDEGIDVSQLTQNGKYLPFILKEQQELDGELVRLNLSVPKFDVNASLDLVSGLQQLGITEVFSPSAADFSPSLDTDLPVWVNSANQSLRVSIDEEGLEAASYTLLIAPGAAEPQELPVLDFVLDRPFLFVIERNNLPIFTGIVNEP